MKLFAAAAVFACCLGLTFGCRVSGLRSVPAALTAPDARVPKDTYRLSVDAKKPSDAPPAPFSHLNHSTKNYSADGTRLIACVECHHTEQPASAAAKTPPLKTAHPADRTTTLTADLLAKDPQAPDVVACRACHAQEGVKPKLLAANPIVTYDGDTDPTILDNEEAYHRNCNICHDQVAERKKEFKITSQKCAECHTGK